MYEVDAIMRSMHLKGCRPGRISSIHPVWSHSCGNSVHVCVNEGGAALSTPDCVPCDTLLAALFPLSTSDSAL